MYITESRKENWKILNFTEHQEIQASELCYKPLAIPTSGVMERLFI